MQYAYTCPSCGWTGDRITTIAKRDEVVCDQPYKHQVEGPVALAVASTCKSLLKRDEDIALTSNMGIQWGEWRRNA